MKFSYKVIKNKNHEVEPAEMSIEKPKSKVSAKTVSFILVAQNMLGFRECAKIVNIAKETNCKIKIASGSKIGTSDSMLSLVALEIVAEKSLVLTISGKRNDEAFREVSKIINASEE